MSSFWNISHINARTHSHSHSWNNRKSCNVSLARTFNLFFRMCVMMCHDMWHTQTHPAGTWTNRFWSEKPSTSTSTRQSMYSTGVCVGNIAIISRKFFGRAFYVHSIWLSCFFLLAAKSTAHSGDKNWNIQWIESVGFLFVSFRKLNEMNCTLEW